MLANILSINEGVGMSPHLYLFLLGDIRIDMGYLGGWGKLAHACMAIL